MRKLPNEYRHLPAGKRVEEAQAEFDAANKAVVEAVRVARDGKFRHPEDMHKAAARSEAALQQLKQAWAEFDSATGGPEIIRSTPLVLRKIQQSFPSDQQSDVLGLVEEGVGRNLPFRERNNAQELERLRLAVIKNARGDLSELRRQIEIAKVDWRDAINSAEYPEASAMGFVEYERLDELSRVAVRERDRQQYLAWLGGSE